MTKDEALRLALEAMKVNNNAWEFLADSGDAGFWKAEEQGYYQLSEKAITAVEVALEAKDEPYALEASMYSNDRMKVDTVTGNVSIGTVKKPCGLECDCTNVCKQDDYKALWQQMCERCDELDKKLAQLEAKDEPVAWAHYTTFNNLNTFEKSRFTATLSKKETNACCVPLYTAPQRTWVGLTEKDICEAAVKSQEGISPRDDTLRFAIAIEAKLKEKNT